MERFHKPVFYSQEVIETYQMFELMKYAIKVVWNLMAAAFPQKSWDKATFAAPQHHFLF